MFLSFIFLQRMYLHFNVAKKNIRPFSSRFSIHSKIIMETRKKVIWIKFTKGKFALQTHLQQIDVIVLYMHDMWCRCIVLYWLEYIVKRSHCYCHGIKNFFFWLMTYNLWTQLLYKNMRDVYKFNARVYHIVMIYSNYWTMHRNVFCS